MSVYKPNSWGRTRSPKNLAGPPSTEVTFSAAADLLGVSATTTGYLTENQRYLHLLVTDANASGAPGAITLFGYCHAFEKLIIFFIFVFIFDLVKDSSNSKASFIIFNLSSTFSNKKDSE